MIPFVEGSILGWIVVYPIVMFLILVVYTGQRHDNARDILRDAGPKTLKWTGYTILLIALMQVVFWLFID